MQIHSVQVQTQTPGADGVFNHTLGVNPLSVVYLCLRPLNDTGTLTNFQSYLGICDAVNRCTIRHRGESIIAATGRDLAMLAYLRHAIMPMQATHANTNNYRRCVVLPIVLGRRPFDSGSCLPQTRSGELEIELDLDIADTGYDGLQYTIETSEILGASPSEYESVIQLVQTRAATGINDLDLPVGQLVRGVLLFGTTGFSGAAPAPSWGRISTVLDGVPMGYNSTDFEVSAMLSAMRGVVPPAMDGRSTADTTQTLTENMHNVGSGGFQNYTFLDFDITRDDEHSIDASNLSRFQLRSDAETADLVRAIPIRRVKV